MKQQGKKGRKIGRKARKGTGAWRLVAHARERAAEARGLKKGRDFPAV